MIGTTPRARRWTAATLGVAVGLSLIGCQPRPGDLPATPRPSPAATDLTPDHHPPPRTPEN